jgi:phosphate:Na+ symporter
MRQLNVLSELETIGDIIDKNLCELVEKKIKLTLRFSEEGWNELNDFYEMILENMVIAETAFQLHDSMMAQKLLRHKEHINNHERRLREQHFARLNKGLQESHETSAIHLDLLTHLKRINSCVSHVAYSILRDTQPSD